MSSSCLSGGGRAYGLNLDLIKPPTAFSTSNSSSPSESSNSPLSIFSRKPRTPRKRPNQIYNEAAAILSTAYPKLFPSKNLPKSFRGGSFLSEPPDLDLDLDLFIPGKGYRPPLLETSAAFPRLLEKPRRSPGEVTSRGDLSEICDCDEEDFDAESILDEEVEEGIDSIMGEINRDSMSNYCYGFPVRMGFDFGSGGMRRNELRAMRNVDGGDWWTSPTVNVVDITQRIATIPVEMKKKKKKKTTSSLMASSDKLKENYLASEPHHPTEGLLRLKLNYDDVLSAWSDKGSPIYGESPAAGNDVQERLAQIELFPAAARGGNAIVLSRYKEKRCTRLFSEKIRYQVRKGSADQRPRIKGRFVRTPNSAEDD